MTQRTNFELGIIVFLVVAAIALVLGIVSQASDCWGRGGEMARGLSGTGYVCVEGAGP